MNARSVACSHTSLPLSQKQKASNTISRAYAKFICSPKTKNQKQKIKRLHTHVYAPLIYLHLLFGFSSIFCFSLFDILRCLEFFSFCFLLLIRDNLSAFLSISDTLIAGYFVGASEINRNLHKPPPTTTAKTDDIAAR